MSYYIIKRDKSWGGKKSVPKIIVNSKEFKEEKMRGYASERRTYVIYILAT